MSTQPAVGKPVTIVPGATIPFLEKITQDELNAIVVRQLGKGLFRVRDRKTGVEASFNAFVGPTNPASMNIQVKDFLGASDGYLLGNRKLQDLYVKTVSIAVAHSALFRWDLVVLEPELDDKLSKCNQGGKISVIQGTPSATPSTPDITDDDQIPLAIVKVRPSSTSILSTDIDNSIKKWSKTLDELEALIGTGGGDCDCDTIIAELSAAIVQLQADVVALQAQGGANAGAIASLQSQIATLSATVTALSTEVSTNTASISVLFAQSSASAAAIVALEAAVVTLQSQTSAIPALQAQAAQLAADMAALASLYSSMQAQLSALSTQTSINSADILQIKSELNAINSEIVIIKNDIMAIQTQNAGILTTLATMQIQLTDCSGGLVTLTATVDGLVAQVNLNTASISALDAQVVAIQQTLGNLGNDVADIASTVAYLYTLVTAAEEWDQESNGDLKAYIDNAASMLTIRVATLENLVGKRGDVIVATFGSGDLSNPTGIVTDAYGNVYICDSANHRIEKRAFDGAHVAYYGVFGSGNLQFSFPMGIAINAVGDKMAVADSMNHRVQILNFPAMTFNSAFGSFGSGNSNLNQPTDVEFNNAGTIFVTDRFNHCVKRFSAAGVFEAKIGGYGTGEAQFNEPFGVAIDSVGAGENIYVVDRQNYRVQKLDSAGAFLQLVGSSPDSSVFDLSLWTNPVYIYGAFNYAYGGSNGAIETPAGTLIGQWFSPNWVLSRSVDGGYTYGPFVILPAPGGNNSWGFGHGGCFVQTSPTRITYISYHLGGPDAGQIISGYSDDEGLTWTAPQNLTSGANLNYACFAIAKNGHVYVSGNTNGGYATPVKQVWKSTNGGAAFTRMTDTPGNGNSYNHKLVGCGNGDILVASVIGGGLGINRSTDGGTSWTFAQPAALAGMLGQFAFEITRLNDDTLLLVSPNNSMTGMFYSLSTDNGTTWSAPAAFTGTSVGFPLTLFQRPNRDILVSINQSEVDIKVYRSNAGGFIGGSADGKFNIPSDVDVDPLTDFVLVADSANDRIQTFDTSGQFVSKFGSSGAGIGQFLSPEGVTVSSAGQIWVSEVGNNRIDKLLSPVTVTAKLNQLIDAVNTAHSLSINKL